MRSPSRPPAWLCVWFTLVLIGVVAAAGGSTGPRAGASPATPVSATPNATPTRPNVLLLISDDQTWSMFNRQLMPNVYSQLVDKGVLFDRAYVNTSMCCPSRSQMFTGLYATDTNVNSNSDPLTRPTIMQAAHDIGYRTLLAGKYVNSQPCQTPLPEFDEWYCYGKKKSTEKNPQIYVDGTPTQMTGYSSDILAHYVEHFISTTPADQPFFAIYAPKDPHLPANDDRFNDIPVPPHRPPNFDEDTTTDNKPKYVQRGPLTQHEISGIDKAFTGMYRSSRGVDDAVGGVLASLGSRADNTIVFFISDNGVMAGEHRIARGKVVPYEESVNVPMVVRDPLLRSQPTESQALVENVDIAPTIADQLGIPWHADGTSLGPLLDGSSTAVRDAALIEACTSDTGAACWKPHIQKANPRYYGVVTDRYKYVEYATGERELYDRATDPYELDNHAYDPDWTMTENALASRLTALTTPAAPRTTIVTGPSGVVDGGPQTFTYFSPSWAATYQCRLSSSSSPGEWTDCDGQHTSVGPLASGTYTFSVAGTSGGVTDPDPATRTFAVDTSLPIVSVADASDTDAGPNHFVRFAVSLTHASSQWISIEYSTTDGVAESPDTYTSTSGTAWVRPGAIGTYVSVPVVPGAGPATNETFHFHLRNPQVAALGRDVATGTILGIP